jgi:hypothetical protein
LTLGGVLARGIQPGCALCGAEALESGRSPCPPWPGVCGRDEPQRLYGVVGLCVPLFAAGAALVEPPPKRLNSELMAPPAVCGADGKALPLA